MYNSSKNVRSLKLKRVKMGKWAILKDTALLVLDFDGTLTDGFVYIGPNGEEFVRCSKKDSLGIKWLQDVGVSVVVLSRESENAAIRSRCKKLNIVCHTGVKDKTVFIKKFLKRMSRNQISYMGDDINDLEAMKLCSFKATVADGHPLLKRVADYITSARGGDHAVREVCELIIRAKGKEDIITLPV